MLTLFIRTIVLYLLVFMVIRLSGKRQLSDLQPFDLISTLLVADLASVPASDTNIPLMYGIVPILGLFLVQEAMAYLSLKLEWFRYAVCGKPLLMIVKGVVQESSLHDARYTMNDLMEQLRGGGVFELSTVEYAILETDGKLSILLKGPSQRPTYGGLSLESPDARPPFLIVQDGRLHREALRQSGYDENWLKSKLPAAGLKRTDQLLFAFVSGGTLHMQGKLRYGGKAVFLDTGGAK